MPEQRPRALVTAAVRGPGLDPARGAGRPDPRLVARPALPADLQRRAVGRAGGGRGGHHRGRGERPVRRAPLRAAPGGRVQLPGGSDQRRRRRGHRGRHPRAAGAGPQRQRRGRAGRGPALRRHPRVVAADADVRRGEIYKDGTIPYQRFRAWELAGRTAGLVGLGAVGRALRWRLRGLGLEVIAYDPYADEPTGQPGRAPRALRRDLPARPGHPGDDRHDRCQGVRRHAGRRGLPQHGPGPAARHRRPGGRACGRARWRQPASTTSRASRWPSTIR